MSTQTKTKSVQYFLCTEEIFEENLFKYIYRWKYCDSQISFVNSWYIT